MPQLKGGINNLILGVKKGSAKRKPKSKKKHLQLFLHYDLKNINYN